MSTTILNALNFVVVFATIFFLMSTLASHLTEIVSGLRDARGKTMQKQLSAALTKDVASEILADPVIRSFANGSRGSANAKDDAATSAAGKMPSYITPLSFARAVTRKYAADGSVSASSDVLTELLSDAQQRGVAFEVTVVEWFAQFTDRITGTYRRTVTFQLLAIGFLFALALDIDVVHLAQYLWMNPDATSATVGGIASSFAKIQGATTIPDAQALAKNGSVLAQTLNDNLGGGAFGWQQTRAIADGADLGWWGAKILGWFLAAVATSFGAQFWFQILSTGLKIRLVGPLSDTPVASPAASVAAIAHAGAATPGQAVGPSPAVLAGAVAETAVRFASFVTASPAAPLLGSLSSKYEVGSRGPGAVSSGVGDPGGVSYGSYQMTSQPDGGTVKTFVAGLPDAQRASFDNCLPGSAAFSAAWKKSAQSNSAGFFMLQHDFIRTTHYEPLCGTVAATVDIATRSFALQNVVWSTAVQHGPHTGILALVVRNFSFDGGPVYELDGLVIKAIYAERGRRLPDGTLAYFTRSSAAVQAGVSKRFVDEQSDALQMLSQESEPGRALAQADLYTV